MASNAEQLEQLTAYLDGELSPAQRAEVDRLLAGDPGARALLDELRQTSQLVSTLPREPAPEGIAAAVVNRMERRDLLGESPPLHATSSRVASWPRRFAVAASIGLVGTAVWIAWPYFPQLMDAEKQPLRVAQMDRSAETPTQLPLEGRDQSEISKMKTLRRSARPAAGSGLAERSVRGKAPLSLGYVGDDADGDEPSADAEDETIPAFAKRFVAKLESPTAEQRAAGASTDPEPTQSVIIETDVATIVRLTDLVEKDMARHSVPMLPAEAEEQVAQRDEAFFTLRRTALPSPALSSAVTRSRAAITGDEIHIVMRVPRDVAEQMLTDIYRISDEPDTEKDEEKTPPTLVRLEKNRTISPAAQDTADSRDEGLLDDESLSAQKRDLGRLDSVNAASQPAPPPDEPLVTLTIHLRTKPAISSAATTQPTTQPSGLPTSQTAPRPTTQEAPGG